jgi:hypothetical protein
MIQGGTQGIVQMILGFTEITKDAGGQNGNGDHGDNQKTKAKNDPESNGFG